MKKKIYSTEGIYTEKKYSTYVFYERRQRYATTEGISHWGKKIIISSSLIKKKQWDVYIYREKKNLSFKTKKILLYMSI